MHLCIKIDNIDFTRSKPQLHITKEATKGFPSYRDMVNDKNNSSLSISLTKIHIS